MLTHVDDHADSRKGRSQVLRVRRSHRDWDDAGVQAPVEGSNQINTCARRQKTSAVSTKQAERQHQGRRRAAVHLEDKAAPRCLQC